MWLILRTQYNKFQLKNYDFGEFNVQYRANFIEWSR